jgi:hypothetical protein
MNLYIVNSIFSSSQRTREEKWFHQSGTFILHNPSEEDYFDEGDFQSVILSESQNEMIIIPNQERQKDPVPYLVLCSSIELELFLKKDKHVILPRTIDLIIGSDRNFDVYWNSICIARYKKGYFDPVPMFVVPFSELEIKFCGREIKLIGMICSNETRGKLVDSTIPFFFPNSTYIIRAGQIENRFDYNLRSRIQDKHGKEITFEELKQ